MDLRTRRALATTFAVVIVLIVGWTALRFVRRIPAMVGDTLIGKEEETVDVESIVTKVQDLSRLETAAMRVMHVSTIRQSYGVVPDSFAGDTLTFLAVGDVIAGVDLSRVERDDVTLDADGVLTIVLPPSEILVTRLDNEKSRVMNRTTGMLRRSDVHLESRARAQAEGSVRREALDKGILRIADEEAERKLADFLAKLGATRVRFRSAGPREE